MRYPGLDLVVVDNPTTGPHTNIGSAINAAQQAPGASVWIPTSYTGNDAVPLSPSVPVFDMRGTGSTSFSAGGVGSGAAPIMGFYLSSACPAANTGNCFNTPADTQQANDCGWTSGSAVITCSTAHFTASDVGKRAFGYQTCAASINLAANNNNNPITLGAALTIQTVNSPTSVTLSGNAANTVTVSAAFPQGGCFIWGHPDDSGAAAMDTAMQAANFCPKFDLAAANYMFTTPHFFTNPTACKALGVLVGGAATAGNIVYSSGYELSGRGAGTTNIFLPPGFPESGGCANGNSAHALFVIPTQGKWSNLQITGGGNRIASGIVTSPCILVEMDGPASMQDVVLTNFAGRGSGNIAATGIGAYLWSQLNHVNISGWGTRGLQTNISSSVTAIQLWIENFGNWGIGVGGLTDYFVQSVSQFSKYNLICYDCTVSLESTVDASGAAMLVNNGLAVKWYRGAMSTLAFPGQTANNILGYDCIASGCVFDVEDAFLDLSQPSTGTGYIAINHATSSPGTNYIKNSIIKGSSGGSAYTDVAGSKLFDMGGNTWGTVSVLGTVIGPTNSARGTACATGNFALTSGWGTSSVASVAANGDIQGCHVTITGAAGSAGPVLTWTYPAAPIVAPGSCHLSGVSGTLTGVSSGTPGTTTVVFTFGGTPSAQTYSFDVGCP